MTVLVIAEHNNQSLSPASLNTMQAAKLLSEQFTVIVLGGQGSSAVAEETKQFDGVVKVLHVESDTFNHPMAESVASTLADVAKDFKYVLAPATTFGKNCLPRLAALLDVAQISDVIEIIDENTFKRPIYAGNAIATVKSHDPIKVMTVRPTAFAAIEATGQDASVEALTSSPENKGSEFVEHKLNVSERPELTSAKIVVSGGRALKSEENFELIEQLAEKLNAAVGASRAAVDAGYVPNDYQVGQTGKVVAPDLYIAIGISGAIQHLAGMKDSKTIVAINKDPEAPIFQIADYGLVGDLFEIVPELTAKI